MSSPTISSPAMSSPSMSSPANSAIPKKPPPLQHSEWWQFPRSALDRSETQLERERLVLTVTVTFTVSFVIFLLFISAPCTLVAISQLEFLYEYMDMETNRALIAAEVHARVDEIYVRLLKLAIFSVASCVDTSRDWHTMTPKVDTRWPLVISRQRAASCLIDHLPMHASFSPARSVCCCGRHDLSGRAHSPRTLPATQLAIVLSTAPLLPTDRNSCGRLS